MSIEATKRGLASTVMYMALEWGDVDFTTGKIVVDKSSRGPPKNG